MSTLMTIGLGLLAAILVLGPLIMLHEWGHYIVARLCGVKVLTYSIGFGPKLINWKSKKTGIDYRLSALPLGGYVRMLDEREGEVDPSEKHLAFNNQHPLKKIAIVAAGPLMNFIIAIGLFWVLFLTPSEQFNTRIGSILDGTPAAAMSLNVGDKVTQIDGHDVQTWEEINYRLADRMGETGEIAVTVIPVPDDVAAAIDVNNAKHTAVTKDRLDTNVLATKAIETDSNQSHDPVTYKAPINQFMQGEDKAQDALSNLGLLPWQPTIEPVVSKLSEGGAASRQGMKIGDKILSINGTPINDWISATRIIRDNPETLLDFTVLRDGEQVDLRIMPQGKKGNMGHVYGQIGAGVSPPEVVVPEAYKTMVVYDPMTALGKSFDKTGQLAVMTVSSMGKMISGTIGLDNLSGPITIATVAKQSFEISWQMVLSTAALISLSLAVLNLLPIPVLDGGHLVYYAIELIRGKPVSEKAQIVGFNIGFILLGGFMILAIGNDISRFL